MRAALEASPNSLLKTSIPTSFAAKGLNLNSYSTSPLLALDNLLETSKLKNKVDVILWHDTTINTIAKHRQNYNEGETVSNLIKTL